MYCGKCGKKNPDNAIYCGKCGEKIGGVSTSSSAKKIVAIEPSAYKKKKSFLDRLFWWQMSERGIQKQVKDYDTLKIYRSYRGISSLLLIFSAIVSIILYVLPGNYGAMLDALAMLFLAYFVNKGKTWALIASMVLWTFERGYAIVVDSDMFIISIVWWLIYMSAFYNALKVEQLRFARH